MSPSDRRQLVDAAFAEAIELTVEDRAAFLDQACPDATFRAEVEAMLAADAQADAYFQAAADRLAVSAEEVTARPPERAGPWRPVRLLGRGGMGEVYLAERADAETPDGFAQRAALKLVQPGLAPHLVARFHAERRILAGLEHPGIARLLDGGTASDGRPYLAMEVVDGEPITTYCDRRRLDVEERLRLFVQACEAVQYAHRQLVVHRDLKPSNVLVTELETGERRVKLLDFGVARLLGGDQEVTRLEARALTPEYAAPEQLRGESPTTATDVYALGVLLYELLAGQRPFQLADRMAEEVGRVIHDERPTDLSRVVQQTVTLPTGREITPNTVADARATRPERLHRRLRGDLDRIAQVALRKEPERRYVSADAFGRDIQRHLKGMPIEARGDTLGYRVLCFVRRNRGLVVTAVIGLMLLVAYGVTVTYQRAQIAQERDRAERIAVLLQNLFSEANPYVDDSTATTAATPLGDALHEASQRILADSTLDADVQYDLLASLAGSLAGLGVDSLAETVRAAQHQLAVDDFGKDDPRAIEATRQLGMHISETSRSTADDARAESLLREAVERSEQALGPSDRRTGETLVELATHLYPRGGADEAEALARRGVEIARRHRPEADLATALMIWALTLREQGENERAWEAAREAVEIARTERPEDSTNLVAVLGNASLAAQAVGRMDDAVSLETEALEIARRQLGSDHPTALTLASNLSTTLWTLGRLEEAEAMQRSVLASRLERFGPNHPDTGVSYQQLGGLLRDQGDAAEAVAAYQTAAAAFDASTAETVPVRAYPYLSLAKLEADRGRYEAAEVAAREAMRLLARSLGRESVAYGDAEARLGRARFGLGDEAGGSRHLEAGLAILSAALGSTDPRVQEAQSWAAEGRDETPAR